MSLFEADDESNVMKKAGIIKGNNDQVSLLHFLIACFNVIWLVF
jgi:hypothetical protein